MANPFAVARTPVGRALTGKLPRGTDRSTSRCRKLQSNIEHQPDGGSATTASPSSGSAEIRSSTAVAPVGARLTNNAPDSDPDDVEDLDDDGGPDRRCSLWPSLKDASEWPALGGNRVDGYQLARREECDEDRPSPVVGAEDRHVTARIIFRLSRGLPMSRRVRACRLSTASASSTRPLLRSQRGDSGVPSRIVRMNKGRQRAVGEHPAPCPQAPGSDGAAHCVDDCGSHREHGDQDGQVADHATSVGRIPRPSAGHRDVRADRDAHEAAQHDQLPEARWRRTASPIGRRNMPGRRCTPFAGRTCRSPRRRSARRRTCRPAKRRRGGLRATALSEKETVRREGRRR